jgi:hypothetical protein
MLYDESLIASEARGISVRELRGQSATCRGADVGRDDHKPLLRYLDGAVAAIEAALVAAKANASVPTVVALPAIGDAALAAHRIPLPRRSVVAPSRPF